MMKYKWEDKVVKSGREKIKYNCKMTKAFITSVK